LTLVQIFIFFCYADDEWDSSNCSFTWHSLSQIHCGCIAKCFCALYNLPHQTVADKSTSKRTNFEVIYWTICELVASAAMGIKNEQNAEIKVKIANPAVHFNQPTDESSNVSLCSVGAHRILTTFFH